MNPLPGDVFARRLRVERERRSMSQAVLARRIAELLETNVDTTAITRIEQQTRAVRLDEAVAAARALDVPLIALISDDATRENEAAIQEKLVDLSLAEQDWERQRAEIDEIIRSIQNLSAERKQLRAWAARQPDLNPDQPRAPVIGLRPGMGQEPQDPEDGPVTDPAT